MGGEGLGLAQFRGSSFPMLQAFKQKAKAFDRGDLSPIFTESLVSAGRHFVGSDQIARFQVDEVSGRPDQGLEDQFFSALCLHPELFQNLMGLEEEFSVPEHQGSFEIIFYALIADRFFGSLKAMEVVVDIILVERSRGNGQQLGGQFFDRCQIKIGIEAFDKGPGQVVADLPGQPVVSRVKKIIFAHSILLSLERLQ